MLEGLNRIDWARLQGAFGPATRTPELIRLLASPNPREQNLGLDALAHTLNYQSLIYPATLAAFPFLIEILKNEGVQNKNFPLTLLYLLAGGRDYCIDYESLDEHFGNWMGRYHPTEEEQEGFAIAMRQNLCQSLDIYIRHLKHKEFDTRMAATRLCVMLHEDAPRIIPELISVYNTESEPLARADLVLSIDILTDQPHDFFSDALKTEPALLPRLICFAGRLKKQGTDTSPLELDEFRLLIRRSDRALWLAYQRLLLSNDFIMDLMMPLVSIEPKYQEEMLRLCIDMEMSAFHYRCGHALLTLALYPDGDLEALNKTSLDVISLIAKTAWQDAASSWSHVTDLFYQFELPTKRVEMRRFLLEGYKRLGIELDGCRDSLEQTTGNQFFDTFFSYMEEFLVQPKKPWWQFW